MFSDEQIIRRVLDGSIDDYRVLMNRYQSAVFRLAYRILGRREDAEDAVQEIFVKAFSKLADCREPGKFWPWIRTITVNACVRRFSRETPTEEIESLCDSELPSVDPVQLEVLRRVQAVEVQKMIAGLPETYRVVIVLRYIEDLSYKEIARLVGIESHTVAARLHRAKKLLAERLVVFKNAMC